MISAVWNLLFIEVDTDSLQTGGQRAEVLGKIGVHGRKWPAASGVEQTQEENMTGNGGSWVLLSLFLVLTVFCNYGGTLKCYSCPVNRYACNTSTTCPPEKNACLKVSVGESHVYDCYKISLCNDDAIAKEFKIPSFKFKCCQWDLCNKGMANMVTKTTLIPSSLIAVIWSLYF
ncbi:CD59 glycoprotein [Tachyglossus aculeatus]|uniref:CD59 glycoprotein n=1 Tax=Tachyglossus aculeatus TaxID=9261 RepID=UPI0018F6274C|nr:CD59 glycoprotein [Tachyglossus aculeatus]